MNRPNRIRHRQTLSVKQTRRSADQRRSHGRTTQASIHVLFVARLRSLRDAVAYFTRLLGYTVRTVDSVASALIVLRRTPVDIVVVEEEQDVPVLLMTLPLMTLSLLLFLKLHLYSTLSGSQCVNRDTYIMKTRAQASKVSRYATFCWWIDAVG